TALTIAASDLLADDTDVDGDSLSLQSVGNATGGTVALDGDGDVLFTPAADFNGQATFEYTVTDGTATSTQTVTVDVAAVNDAPVAVADTLNTFLDTPLTIQSIELTGNDTDVDGDALTVTSVSAGTGGVPVFDPDTAEVIFTPSDGFTGTATFSYTVSDGNGLTDTATATVSVAANATPDAAPDTAWTTVNAAILIGATDLLADDVDPDGDVISLTAVGNATGGTVSLDGNGDVVFTPDAGFTGQASFDYTIDDGKGATDTATVTVDVTTPPVAGDAAAQVASGGNASWMLTSMGGDGVLTYVIDGLAASTDATYLEDAGWFETVGGGFVRIADAAAGTYEYQSGAGQAGADSFDFRVTDSRGLTSTATVDIGVGAGGYSIDQGLTFDAGSGTRLDRTFGAPTSATTWTLSAWVKRDSLGSQQMIMASTGDRDRLYFESNDALAVRWNDSGAMQTSYRFTDASRWYHIVWRVDMTQSSASERMQIYVDGEQLTAFDYQNMPGQNSTASTFNQSAQHTIGARTNGSERGDFDIADVVFTDGQAYGADTFGEYDDDGNWVPVDTSDVTYGSNGFHLDFSDSGDLGADSAGGNNFASTNINASNQVLGSDAEPLPSNGSGTSVTATSGNDRLMGSEGDDTLEGLAGDDYLAGGGGNDTYLLGRNSGADTIDNTGEGGANDRIVFNASIAQDQLWFRQVDNDLEVSVIGTQSIATVQDWYDGSENHVTLEAGDGAVLAAANVQALVDAMAAFSPPAIGETDLSQALHDQLDTVLAVNWGPSV
ncbi:MAG: cadherin-like domain-containing protein, partial [Rhodospirillales bacterium]